MFRQRGNTQNKPKCGFVSYLIHPPSGAITFLLQDPPKTRKRERNAVYISAEMNKEFFRSLAPYLRKRKGTGSARHDIPPRRLAAGPTPKFSNIGRAAIGKAHAKTERRIVFAETTLEAKGPYVSTKKFRHCWYTMLNPAAIKPVIAMSARHQVGLGD